MKISNLKATVAKVFTVGLLAGAVVMAAPQKAEAQVSFGVRVGGPVYGRPVYRPYGYGYAAPAPYYGYYGAPHRFYHERFRHEYWR